MRNERYVKKSPNISFLKKLVNRSRFGRQPLVSLACLWRPLKILKQNPRPFISPGTNILQPIIQESSQAAWTAETLKKQEGGGVKYPFGGFQLHISSERYSSFLSSRPLGSTDSLVSMLSQCLCTVSTFLQRNDGYRARPLYPPWKRFPV